MEMKKSDINTVKKLKQDLSELEKLDKQLSFDLDNAYIKLRDIENQRKENFRQRCSVVRELEKFGKVV